MLHIMPVDGVKDPVEAKNRIKHDRHVVPPGVFEAQCVSQEWMFCVRVHQTPVHDNIPDAAVDAIDGCPEDEQDSQSFDLVDTPQTQAHVVENRAHVLAKVGHVGEQTPCIGISAKTLESTPDTWKSRKESKQSRV
ncbi:uncharacterized protein M437DRAFT_57742 [Aureobasidium melanogenum CBS 110374]|uniref:Uncharacterized protein n=1 Tax=Aureobasidium melanogenum (strain CBS 110374) TaxID=1043003 RepID=A0A074W9C9_AURM1|nr:uncharacterized protein M437DRAFT_57742 [Aureobasidium melanogenum CBS 110374]KEQ59111.1 hypothetical protein M437DRAFT_57742 [Aureobasidium melanogenum CBS 110374]